VPIINSKGEEDIKDQKLRDFNIRKAIVNFTKKVKPKTSKAAVTNAWRAVRGNNRARDPANAGTPIKSTLKTHKHWPRESWEDQGPENEKWEKTKRIRRAGYSRGATNTPNTV